MVRQGPFVELAWNDPKVNMFQALVIMSASLYTGEYLCMWDYECMGSHFQLVLEVPLWGCCESWGMSPIYLRSLFSTGQIDLAVHLLAELLSNTRHLTCIHVSIQANIQVWNFRKCCVKELLSRAIISIQFPACLSSCFKSCNLGSEVSSIYKHTCIWTSIHTNIYAYKHTCIQTYMHTSLHAYKHTCNHACIHGTNIPWRCLLPRVYLSLHSLRLYFRLLSFLLAWVRVDSISE